MFPYLLANMERGPEMKHSDYPNVTSMVDRHGKTRWRFRKLGVYVWLRGDPGTPDFDAKYQAALAGNVVEKQKVRYRENPQGVRGNFPHRIERMLRQLRYRSAGLQREFDLSQEWLIAELERCDYRCTLTGIPFQADHVDGKRTNPFAPSIDRIDNARGYTPDNVRLVLVSVNLALSDFGLDHFDEICRARVMKLLTENR
jgi:hypothetical protein